MYYEAPSQITALLSDAVFFCQAVMHNVNADAALQAHLHLH